MSEKNGGPPAKPDVEALRAEIKQTRAELGETVQALAAKADVKARAIHQVEQTRQRVRAQAAEATGRVREAAQLAGGRVRAVTTGHAHGDGDPDATGAAPRRLPVSVPLVVAGVAAVVGIILVMRGRRR